MPVRHSTCPHDCPSCCALEVDVQVDVGQGGRIGTVRGARGQPYTAGVICAKVARYAERVHHPDRLTHPLIRTGRKGEGAFRRAGWDEALDLVARCFEAATAADGPESVWPYYYAGTMGLVQRDGINRLRHAMGYSRQHNTICSSITESGWAAGVGRFGGPDPREMAHSDLLIMWGGNPVSTQVNVMAHVTRARKERGALLVVVDPYRTPTADVADIHLALRPGTDAALACAVMHVAFRDGFADRAYMARHTDATPEFEAHCRERSPAWAAAITGLAEAEIEAFARRYCETDRAFIRLGYGFTRSRNGAVAMHAVTCLPSVTNKWRHEGGGAFWTNRGNGIYHWNKTLIEGLDRIDPATRVMDMSRIGAALTGHLTNDRSELGDGPPVRAMLVQNTNPAVVAPDTHRVRRGLLRDDLFTCVHEQFMTETAALADVVLPATMFLEHDDLYAGGGHTFFSIGPKLIDPPGECRSNHEVIEALAARLGAAGPGFGLSALQLADATLRASGWPGADEVIARRWVDAGDSFERSHFADGFGFPDGRFRFAPDWAALGRHAAGMPRWPDQWDCIDQPSAERPFRLVAAPARNFLNTSFSETPTSRRREGRPTALLGHADAARLGVGDGNLLRIGNAQGDVVLHARLVDGIQPGCIVVESLWPNRDFPDGFGINVLTSDQPAAPNGGAVFHDTAVWVRPAAAVAEPTRLAAD